MDSARWQRIQTLFHEAVEQPPEQQHTFLFSACPEDPALISEVLALLAEDARGDSMLDQSLASYASRMVGLEHASSAFPRLLGPYRLIRVLGQGGMGVVWLAQREDFCNPVAIKFLGDAWMSPARREQFASEQRILAHFDHPCIARFYDADTLPDGTPWLAMEYVDGISLTEYCLEHQCSLQERLTLFRSVCDAVHYSHLRAVIHRDLKPSNILVKADGTVKLLDFGIAKQLEDFSSAGNQTRAELRLMTPAYAAPEQLLGEQTGIFTDVYALGVLLYELLSGQLPYDLANCTPAEVERTVLTQEPEKPSTIARSSPQHFVQATPSAWFDLDVLCLTAMRKEIHRRYQSVEALTRDVDRFLHREPLEAQPDQFGYRLSKFVQRNQRTLLTTALVATFIFLMGAYSAIRLSKARQAILASAERTQRVQKFMLRLFDGDDPSAGPAGDLRVITLIDRGMREARSLNNEPAMQAELYQTLGNIYQKLGKLDRADALLQSSLESRKAIFGEQSVETAKSLTALGLLRVSQAQLGDAEQYIRRALKALRNAPPSDNEILAQATAALGKVLQQKGAYSESVSKLEEAIKLESHSPENRVDLAASLHELAGTEFYLGHYDVCDSLNQRALAIHRELFGDGHPLVADDLIDFGSVQFQRGHYPEAEKLYRQALDINRHWYGDSHPETASNLMTVAQALSFQNRFDEATTLLKQALAIQEHVYGTNHPRVAIVLNELAIIAAHFNRLAEAESYYRRVIAIHKSVSGNHSLQAEVAWGNLATVYLDRKNYVQAERILRGEIERLTQFVPANHFNIGVAQIKLGRALLRQRRYAEAEEHSLLGLNIVQEQASPSIVFLRTARMDLASIYKELNQPEKAKQYEQETTVFNSKKISLRR